MTYDLAPVSAPRTAGFSLRLLVWALEHEPTRSMLVGTLLESAGVAAMREQSAGLASAAFVPPLDAPVRRAAPASELVSISDFLASEVGDLPAGPSGHAFRSARWLVRAFREGALTPLTVAERALAAVRESEARDPALRVFIAQQEEDVLAQARASTERYRAGKPLGPLDGVPIAVKDELDQAGYPTTVGTVIHGRAPAEHDATAVARLRAAGAVLLGKVNMHEIGIGVTGLNPHHGACRNPYAPGHVTGGSSSGSAAAVAAGFCPITVGCDGGGSVRIPAAFCGVVGLKPTFSRISEHGVAPVCSSVAHVGAFGATVRDAALAYALMSGPDEHDGLSQRQPPALLPDFRDRDLSGVRLGLFEDWFADAEPAVVAACRAALDRMVAAGAKIVPIEIPELSMVRTAHLISIVAEMAGTQLQAIRAGVHRYGLDTRINLALAQALTGQDYVHAQRHRSRLGVIWAQIMGKVDLIVTPATGRTAPAYPPDALPLGESNMPLTLVIMRYAQAANLFGLPAISVPAGYDEAGLPIGLQLMGRAWEEALVLRAAAVVEAGVERKKPQAWWDLGG
ncbi:MAG: amidase [Pseudomonadota bacterium]